MVPGNPLCYGKHFQQHRPSYQIIFCFLTHQAIKATLTYERITFHFQEHADRKQQDILVSKTDSHSRAAELNEYSMLV